MNYQIDPHTLERAEERGATRQEIIEVIETGDPVAAKYGRLAKSKVFTFQQERLSKYYEQKRLEVIYTIENETAVTITSEYHVHVFLQ